MSEENVEIVRRGSEMFAAGDLEGTAALFATEAEVTDAGGLGIADTSVGTRTGPEGFLRSVEDIRDSFDDVTVEPTKFFEAGDSVVASVLISGTGRGSGMKVEMVVAHLWVLRDGKVVRGNVYRTVDEALEAAALAK